jgi:phospholipid transport system substrate-binding protein
MRTMRHRSHRWLLAAAVAALPATALAARAPQQVIREASDQVKSILAVKVTKGSQKEKAQQARLKKVVDRFLDYRELSRRALGPHWKDRSQEQRTEFVALLRELIEESYTGSIRKNVDYELEIEDTEIDDDGAKAHVHAVASSENKKGREVSEFLTFHLYLKDRSWMIYDVEFGDVSLVRHYRGEFNRKIKKESYQALVEVMREKLAEIRSGKKSEREVEL